MKIAISNTLRRGIRWAALVPALAAAEPVSFNEHIRPILSDNCFACHGTDAKHRKADRRMDTADGAAAEIDGVRAIVPGDLAKSDAWVRIISDDPEEVMPPPKSHKPPLTKEQRALIRQWIEEGAKYQRHWAFERVAKPELPSAAGGAGGHPVDRFIGAKLAAKKLALAPEAAREVLLRRVTLDLTGLPPTLAELDAFLADQSADAYERAVERLLASPHYGEQMARPWLDAVRYGDTHGMHFDNLRSIWPYRDWVVAAFNANQPFDQFTIEQLAGDLLPKPTRSQLIASGYNRCNLSTHEGGSITEESMARYTADRLETTAAVWLGLTANCASCHDHKFDPLAQKEYYQLGAFFRGLADREWDGNLALPGPRVLLTNAAQQARLDAIAKELPALESQLAERARKLTVKPGKGPVTYEVIWADDGELPTPENFQDTKAAADWRAGEGVPLAGGQRALRMEGRAERVIPFTTGDTLLLVQTALKAFASVALDPAKPPRAVSIEFISGRARRDAEIPKNSKRLVWGDVKAFGEIADAVAMGPLPLPGDYVRLEADAKTGGLKAGDAYTGIRIALSDGAAWWDRIGMAVTSSPGKDALLSSEAWRKAVRDQLGIEKAPLTLDTQELMQMQGGDPTAEEKARMETFFQQYIHGPSRVALEPEVHRARRLMAEQIAIEKQVAGSLISRELPEPRPAFVLLRGEYNKHGDPVQPATPAFLPALKHEAQRASRLDLARWLVAKENPLTARVTVNRFWQQFFGAGLVRTPGDFGAQGDPPSHAALLDWLADDFVSHGWDVKRMVRLLVTSRTYRQDSRATPALLELDPANRLLARGPRLRLDGEVLRDQALALSGLLQPALGGPPVKPYQPDNVWEPVAFGGSNTRKYERDTGPALYRRSLYTLWKRTAPPVSLATFDAPARESFCTGRQRTNTPLQALALMNDVQQIEAARAFAERLLTTDGDDATRLARAFRTATSRQPTDAEKRLLADALAAQRARFAADLPAAQKLLANGESKPTHPLPEAEFAAWTLVANLLLNLDETINRN